VCNTECRPRLGSAQTLTPTRRLNGSTGQRITRHVRGRSFNIPEYRSANPRPSKRDRPFSIRDRPFSVLEPSIMHARFAHLCPLPSTGIDRPSTGIDRPSTGIDRPSAGIDRPSAGVPIHSAAPPADRLRLRASSRPSQLARGLSQDPGTCGRSASSPSPPEVRRTRTKSGAMTLNG
jgi:hypothetical protein